MKLIIKTFLNSKVALIIAAITIFYFAVEFFWKPPFMGGRVVGVYKLFVFLDKTDARLSILAMILSISLFFYLFVENIEKSHPQLLVIGFDLLLSSLILGFTWLYGVRWSTTRQLDSLSVEGKAYYLASYKTDSLNSDFRLYECDSIGFLCRLAYYSGDLETIIENGTLKYDPSNNKILVGIGYKKDFYEYEIP